MPSLIFMAACDKVLHEDQTPTLVGVWAALKVGIKGDAPAPKAVAPKPWAVFAFWRADNKDKGGKFIQKTSVLTPSGDEFGHSEDGFQFDAATHNVRTSIPGLPIGIEGNMKIQVWLERDGKSVTPKHEYIVSIEHAREK